MMGNDVEEEETALEPPRVPDHQSTGECPEPRHTSSFNPVSSARRRVCSPSQGPQKNLKHN